MLVITPVIKFPERKIESLLLDKWKNMNKLEGEKIDTGICMYTKVYSRKHTRLSDSQTKLTNGGTNGPTCGWADRGKDR